MGATNESADGRGEERIRKEDLRRRDTAGIVTRETWKYDIRYVCNALGKRLREKLGQRGKTIEIRAALCRRFRREDAEGFKKLERAVDVVDWELCFSQQRSAFYHRRKRGV